MIVTLGKHHIQEFGVFHVHDTRREGRRLWDCTTRLGGRMVAYLHWSIGASKEP